MLGVVVVGSVSVGRWGCGFGWIIGYWRLWFGFLLVLSLVFCVFCFDGFVVDCVGGVGWVLCVIGGFFFWLNFGYVNCFLFIFVLIGWCGWILRGVRCCCCWGCFIMCCV